MGCGWGQSVNNLQAGDRTGMDGTVGGHRFEHSAGSWCSFSLSHAARVASSRITNSEPVASSGVCRVEKNASQRFPVHIIAASFALAGGCLNTANPGMLLFLQGTTHLRWAPQSQILAFNRRPSLSGARAALRDRRAR